MQNPGQTAHSFSSKTPNDFTNTTTVDHLSDRKHCRLKLGHGFSKPIQVAGSRQWIYLARHTH